jgi:hypothetical protein
VTTITLMFGVAAVVLAVMLTIHKLEERSRRRDREIVRRIHTHWDDLDKWGFAGFLLAIGFAVCVTLTIVVAFLWWLL